MSSALSIVVGLGLLAGGGELLVRGAVWLAERYGVTPLVIGLTVVAFGTSAPELAVTLRAVDAGAADLAIGNVVGSNIFNILFILGVSALIVPLSVSRRVVWVEVPIMIGFSILTLLLALDGRLQVWEGVTLMGLLVVYTGWLVRAGAREPALEEPAGHARVRGAAGGTLFVVAGLAALLAGARWLVAGAVDLAATLGVNDAVIGLTIVAAGTSLPEVAASIVASIRGQREIAIGNVVGSNIFNLTLILGSTVVAAGGLAVSPGLVTFDLVVMAAVAAACLPIVFTGHTIARWEGGLFFAYYVAYTAYLVLDASEHALVSRFRDAMVFFALPLTAVTLAVMAFRAAVSRSRV